MNGDTNELHKNEDIYGQKFTLFHPSLYKLIFVKTTYSMNQKASIKAIQYIIAASASIALDWRRNPVKYFFFLLFSPCLPATLFYFENVEDLLLVEVIEERKWVYYRRI